METLICLLTHILNGGVWEEHNVITGLIILAAIILLIVTLVFMLVNGIKNSSFGWFSNVFLKDGWKYQGEQLAATPKSISSMTRLYEPRIHKDFPEFN